MYRIAIAALLLAFSASGNAAQLGGLHLNATVVKLTGNLPLLGNLASIKGPSLPVLGELPGLNLPLGQRVILLGNINVADLLDAVDVGRSGHDYVRVLTGQLRKEVDLLNSRP